VEAKRRPRSADSTHAADTSMARCVPGSGRVCDRGRWGLAVAVHLDGRARRARRNSLHPFRVPRHGERCSLSVTIEESFLRVLLDAHMLVTARLATSRTCADCCRAWLSRRSYRRRCYSAEYRNRRPASASIHGFDSNRQQLERLSATLRASAARKADVIHATYVAPFGSPCPVVVSVHTSVSVISTVFFLAR